MNPSTFNPSLAFIEDQGNIFQVLNDAGTDWDEAKTAAAYRAWLASLTTNSETLH